MEFATTEFVTTEFVTPQKEKKKKRTAKKAQSAATILHIDGLDFALPNKASIEVINIHFHGPNGSLHGLQQCPKMFCEYATVNKEHL